METDHLHEATIEDSLANGIDSLAYLEGTEKVRREVSSDVKNKESHQTLLCHFVVGHVLKYLSYHTVREMKDIHLVTETLEKVLHVSFNDTEIFTVNIFRSKKKSPTLIFFTQRELLWRNS